MDELVSIGEVARASGLSVSALRFYDRSGVLVPAEVAPDTGYRWYAGSQLEAARLIAGLRRVGLPLAEVSTVLAHDDPAVTDRILDEHVRRLEDGLAAACAEVDRIRRRWTDVGAAAVRTVAGEDLTAALRAVRHAVGADPRWPALQGVLLETAGSALRVSATDRHRAAFHEIPADGEPGELREVVPAAFVDRLIELVSEGDVVELTVGDGRVRATFAGNVEEGRLLDADFPDLARVVPDAAAASAVVAGRQLLEGLRAAPGVATWYLGLRAGTVALSHEADDDEEWEVVLNGEFLAQAVQAAGGGQLRLDLAGPIAPLAIRRVEEPGSFSVIMPIRPEESPA